MGRGEEKRGGEVGKGSRVREEDIPEEERGSMGNWKRGERRDGTERREESEVEERNRERER